MRIIAISDLHGDLPATLPEGDVLVIAGDLAPDDWTPDGAQKGTTTRSRQARWHHEVFTPWLNALPYAHIIYIAGNHDFYLEGVNIAPPDEGKSIHYLNEDLVNIDGVTFYGAPWNMTQGWAFALTEREYAQRLGKVPEGVDVLVTHGPPLIADMPGFHWTSQILADWIGLTPFKAVICGHTHEAFGQYAIGDTPVYVVSIKDRKYDSVQPPTIIELETS